MSKSGKTSTILLGILAVFFVCTTGIAAFFFVQEAQIRKGFEMKVEELNASQAKLQADLQETQKNLSVTDEKKKEAEAKIDNLMNELQVEQGLKEGLKKQNMQLAEDLEKEKQSKEELRQQMSKDLSSAEQKVKELGQKIDMVSKQKDEIETRRSELQKQYDEIKGKLDQMQSASSAAVPMEPSAVGMTPESTPKPATAKPAAPEPGVQLGKIVVNPEPGAGATAERGKIITIDTDAEFLIVALGAKDGVKGDSVLSVFRGDKYLGDVKATRVLEDMCAVDFVAPLTSKGVTKDDRVVLKK